MASLSQFLYFWAERVQNTFFLEIAFGEVICLQFCHFQLECPLVNNGQQSVRFGWTCPGGTDAEWITQKSEHFTRDFEMLKTGLKVFSQTF